MKVFEINKGIRILVVFQIDQFTSVSSDFLDIVLFYTDRFLSVQCLSDRVVLFQIDQCSSDRAGCSLPVVCNYSPFSDFQM